MTVYLPSTPDTCQSDDLSSYNPLKRVPNVRKGETMEKLPIALVQASILRKSPEENHRMLVRETTRAGELGARIAILPELWNVAYLPGTKDAPELKEEQALEPFREVARRYGMAIVAGSMAVKSKEERVNRCHVVGPGGDLVGAYDKVHPFRLFNESGSFKAGSTLGLVELFGWKIGILVCFDIEFPELCRALAEKGAEALLVAGAWPLDHVRIWRTLLVARAIENQLFTVGANRCDKGPSIRFGGTSLVVDPYGEIILHLDDLPRTEIAVLLKGKVENARKTHPVWNSRREELYKKWK